MSNLTLAGLGQRVGHELGVSDWVTIDQARIDAFASCTGDHQWIHVDVERAKRESPFRGPIAHGYLTLAMVAPLAMQIGVIPSDAAAGLNYGIDKVRFLAPVPAGARVRLRVVLAGIEPRDGGQVIMKTQNTLEVEGSEKPALIAETLALLIPAAGARLAMSTENREQARRSRRGSPKTHPEIRWHSIPLVGIRGAGSASTAPASCSRRSSTNRRSPPSNGSLSSANSALSSPASPSVRRRQATGDFPMPTWKESCTARRDAQGLSCLGRCGQRPRRQDEPERHRQGAGASGHGNPDRCGRADQCNADQPGGGAQIRGYRRPKPVAGLKNYFDDLTKNGGMPSMVDQSAFKVGENLWRPRRARWSSATNCWS